MSGLRCRKLNAALALCCALVVGCTQQPETPSARSEAASRVESPASSPVDSSLEKTAAASSSAPAESQAAEDKNPPSPTQPEGSPPAKTPLEQSSAEPKNSSEADDSDETEDAHESGPASEAAHGAYDKKEAIDPVKLNGPIFENWPKPEFAILISGEQLGYIEPCGCAGLENQKGGLSRRHTLIKSLREQGWPLVAADLGGQVQRYGTQTEIKYRATIGALVEIGYQAVGFGPQDLRMPTEHLIGVAANLDGKSNPFVCANVGLFEFDNGFVARYRIVEAGGKKIAITSIFGDPYHKRINNPDLKMIPAEQGLQHIIEELTSKSDFQILLSHATPEESKSLARKFPQFDLVVTADGAEEPPYEAATIEGSKAKLVEVGHKGMYVAVLGFYNDAETPVRYQRVPLDARFADSPAMKKVLADYQKELAVLGLSGLGLKPRVHPTGREFVGSATCGDCHTKAHAIWSKTPHSHATETLVKLTPQRHHDPECLSCHATGWEPQKYFPFESGYLSLEKTPDLTANGCENCHGPGAQHAAAEMGEIDATEEQLATWRDQMKLPLAKAEAKCIECHDLDNSPEFKFKEYWEEVKHSGKD